MIVPGVAQQRRADWPYVAAALLLTTAVIWLISRQPLVTGAYLGGVVALGAGAASFLLQRPQAVSGELAPPDWSVTIVAIADAGDAVVITDRAGRTVCANPAYESAFGAATPPRFGFDTASQEKLAAAMRAAWRDGSGDAAPLRQRDDAEEHRCWQCRVERAGRAEDFLVWRLSGFTPADPAAEMVARTIAAVEGDFGQVLSQAGISCAVVNSGGAILGANASFIEGAFGDAATEVVGQDFVSRLRRDEEGGLGWARDEGSGPALSFRHMPVGFGDTAPPDVPALMMLAEALPSGAAVGANRAAVPYLEALLDRLPHGIAMADRDGRLLFANAAFVRAAGIEGKPLPPYPTDLVVREDRAALVEAVRRYGMGPANAGDIAVRLVTQPDEPVSLSLAGVRGLGDAAVLLGLEGHQRGGAAQAPGRAGDQDAGGRPARRRRRARFQQYPDRDPRALAT